jgi:glucose-6-phosphate isomerase
MDKIKIDYTECFDYYNGSDYAFAKKEVEEQIKVLENKSGKGNDFLGWLDLPLSVSDSDIEEINKVAGELRTRVDFVVLIGIGGSYLGSRAVIEALSDSFNAYRTNLQTPQILYAGHNISEDYLSEMISFLADKNFGIVVISKSGTTTEPAIAFRLLKELLSRQIGQDQLKEYIIAITDKEKGALKTTAAEENYKSFVIPDDVGGRFSVFTPVGLLPIAIAGFDIKGVLKGALKMKEICDSNQPLEGNIAAHYALIRNILYRNGKTTEIMVNYHGKLHFVAEWWKQLYGESEGKERKGIFPAAVDFTTDLHSMGQFIQDGTRNLFETVLTVEKPEKELRIPKDARNLDKLNYIAGKRIDEVNKMAELGTMIAHVDGGVPNIKICIPALNEHYIGQLLYFFEKACGISGYMLGVNPFDQPGVEDYKRNMFALLGKSGYEKETAAIKKRIK